MKEKIKENKEQIKSHKEQLQMWKEKKRENEKSKDVYQKEVKKLKIYWMNKLKKNEEQIKKS